MEESEIQKIRDELQSAKDKYEQRTVQVEHQLGQLRKITNNTDLQAQAAAQTRPQTYDAGYGYEQPDASQQRQVQFEIAANNRMDLMQFKLDNPDSDEYMSDIMERISESNPDRGRYVIPGPNGTANYYHTLNHTKQAIELERFKAAKAKADALTEEQKPARATQKAKATISGDASVATSEEIDVSKLKEPSDFFKYGLLEEDPNDPIDEKWKPTP